MISCTLQEPNLATTRASRLGSSEQGVLLLSAAWDMYGASIRLIMTVSLLCASKGVMK